MADDGRERAKVLLAEDMERAYLTGFLTVEDIVNAIFPIPDGPTKGEAKPSFATGLERLVALHDFKKIFWPFYLNWSHEEGDDLTLYEAALKGFYPFVAEMSKMLRREGIVRAFRELLHTRDDDGHHVMWGNLVTAFPYRELRACVNLARQRADEVMADAPEAMVVEAEDIEEEVEVTPAAPPATDKPAD